MKLTSSAFAEGQSIPPKYTCDGENVSPPLAWADVPAGTKSFALIMDDPDAPSGLFVHWLIYGIPSSQHGLDEGIGTAKTAAAGVRQGKNGFGKIGYGGPCPPSGTHRYYFHLYALDSELADIDSGVSRQELERAMKRHIIGEAQFMGRYQRKGRSVSK
ncbi:MAG TPA: YbhB/YbcL family Raf kinase inhibitor-like protein [Bryobacteraceae bacterium]|nr:YbhB/YbcL family Raf kinase inhibitor-like protein [Bryobacteraceae bacterium]